MVCGARRIVLVEGDFPLKKNTHTNDVHWTKKCNRTPTKGRNQQAARLNQNVAD
jgi:hypothetical protein